MQNRNVLSKCETLIFLITLLNSRVLLFLLCYFLHFFQTQLECCFLGLLYSQIIIFSFGQTCAYSLLSYQNVRHHIANVR